MFLQRLLLQSVSGIAKGDRLYYKVRHVLQSVAVITKWNVTEFLIIFSVFFVPETIYVISSFNPKTESQLRGNDSRQSSQL